MMVLNTPQCNVTMILKCILKCTRRVLSVGVHTVSGLLPKRGTRWQFTEQAITFPTQYKSDKLKEVLLYSSKHRIRKADLEEGVGSMHHRNNEYRRTCSSGKPRRTWEISSAAPQRHAASQWQNWSQPQNNSSQANYNMSVRRCSIR